MRFAAFIDPEPDGQTLSIELASTLAEFCMLERQSLALLCDASTALEIGLSILGLQETRTVEGGDRLVSPIHLLPFIRRPNSQEDYSLSHRGEVENGGEIDDLYDLGIFARSDEGDEKWEFVDEPGRNLENLIVQRTPEFALGLGMQSELWTSLTRGISRISGRPPSLLLFDGLSRMEFADRLETKVIRRREGVYVKREETKFEEPDEQFRDAEETAKRDGELVGSFLEFLSSLSGSAGDDRPMEKR